MTRTLASWPAATLIALVAASPLAAQATPEPEPRAAVTIVADNITAREDATAGKPRTGADSARLRAGDVVEYRLRFSNPTREAVKNVVLEDPLPPGLLYVGGSAGADVNGVVMEYSIDGGRTWSPRPMITVIEDGREVERPAPPERYTNIRWRVPGSVQPGAQVTASFRARLGAAAPK